MLQKSKCDYPWSGHSSRILAEAEGELGRVLGAGVGSPGRSGADLADAVGGVQCLRCLAPKYEQEGGHATERRNLGTDLDQLLAQRGRLPFDHLLKGKGRLWVTSGLSAPPS